MLIFVLSLGNFAVGMGVFVAIGLLLPIQQAFGLSDAQSGLVLTVYAITYGISSPVLVALTGARARRQVMLIGLGIFAVSAVVLALATSPSQLFGARMISALGAGLFTPVTAGVAASVSKPGQQGKALATVFAGLTFAQVLGVPAGVWIGYTFGWQTAFWLVAVLSIGCMIGVARYVPTDLPFQSTNMRSLRAALINWRGLMVIAFTSVFLGAIYVIYTNLAPLIDARLGYARDGITTLFVLFGVGAVLGNALGGFLADRVGPQRTLIALCLAQAVIMPTFSILPLPDIVVGATIILWGVFGWSFVAGQQLRVVRLSGNSPSVGLALNAAAIYLGATVGSLIGGASIALFGLDALGIVGGLVALLALAQLLISERLVRHGG